MFTKIVICGGHLSPALAVIEKLKENKDYKIYYIGRKKTLEGDVAQSLEYNSINNLDIPFYSINTARFQRNFTLYTIPSLLKFPLGLFQSLRILIRLRPQIIVSFGSYTALPLSIIARVLSIPMITHEQTQVLGLANKIIGRISKVLCLSFKDTLGVPAGVAIQLTGNPIRKSILSNYDNKITHFGDSKLPLIYITGGNLGSRSINKTVAEIVSRLVQNYRVFHQCGDADNGEDFKVLNQRKNLLPEQYKNNYYVVKHIDPKIVGIIYKSVSLIIGRAGANTVNEILFFGKPAILIPLPWAGQNEQEKNAILVKNAGLGKIILQKNLSPELLSTTINSMMDNLHIFRNKIPKSEQLVSAGAAEKIVQVIEQCLREYR